MDEGRKLPRAEWFARDVWRRLPQFKPEEFPIRRSFAPPADSSRSLIPPALGALAIYAGLIFFSHTSGTYEHRPIHKIYIWPSVLLLSFFYWRGYYCIRDGARAALKWAIVSAILFGVVCLFVPPFDSLDLYGYINKGWLQYHYGLDPYVYTVNMAPLWRRDPMLTEFWTTNPCAYGFLFARFVWIICGIGDGNFAATLLLLKFVNLCAGVATGFLLYVSAKRLGIRRPDIVLYLFMWNPLMLLQEIANGHNDILMVMFIVLAIYLAVSDLWLAVIAALTAAFLIKYPAALAIPFALIAIVRRKGLLAAVSACVFAVLLIVVIGAPYLADLSRFQFASMARNLTYSSNSLQATFAHLFHSLIGLSPVFSGSVAVFDLVVKGVIWGVVLGLVGVVALRFAALAKPSTLSLIAAIVWAELLVICVASSKFYPWYIAMFFPMALLLEEGHWLRELAVILSVTELLHFTPLGALLAGNYLILTGLPLMVFGWLRRAAIVGALKGASPLSRPHNLADQHA